MRICIITHEYPPTPLGGGQGTYAMNLVRELVSNKHRVTVLTPLFEGGKEHEKDGNLEIRRLRLFQPPGLLRKLIPNLLDMRIVFGLKIRGLKDRINFRDYDVIHVLDAHDSYFIGKGIKTPVVVSVNDYYSFEMPWNIFRFPYPCSDLLLRYIHHVFTRALNTRYLRRAGSIISNTGYAAVAVSRAISPYRGKIEVIYRGIDIGGFPGRTERGKYTSHKILYIGSNMERKGVEYLVRAMVYITGKFPDARLTIIGRASKLYGKKLKNIIKGNNLEACIELIPHCPPARIYGHYKKSNVFVLPSVIENLGQVLIESMSTKTPVVCTNVGANPEAVVDNVTGMLVEPRNPGQIAEAVIRIFSNPKLARAMGREGRKRVKRMFNSRRMLAETLEVYNKLIKK